MDPNCIELILVYINKGNVYKAPTCQFVFFLSYFNYYEYSFDYFLKCFLFGKILK